MRLLLLSSSKVYEREYLDHAFDRVCAFLHESDSKELLFLPLALKDHDGYFAQVHKRFSESSISVSSIHQAANPIAAIQDAKAFFIGGGNTLVLLRALYDGQLLGPLRERVQAGIPYVGSSAGANVAGITVQTTNDMPIVYPPSLRALQLVPFNINPHFVDQLPGTQISGETRRDRIRQFHEYNEQPVLALPEASVLEVKDNTLRVHGDTVKLFLRGRNDSMDLAPSDSFRAIADLLS